MKCVSELFAVLLAAATVLPASAYEMIGPDSLVAIKDDPTKPYLTYLFSSVLGGRPQGCHPVANDAPA